MRRLLTNWRRAAERVVKWFGYGAVAGAIGLVVLSPSATYGQRGRGRDGGGNAQIRVPSVGGQIRVPSGGAEVRVPGAGGQVRVPGAGADVRLPSVVPGSPGASVRVPGADGQVRVPGAGADVRLPNAGGEVRVPGGEARVRVPGEGQLRVPGVDAGVRGDARTALRPNLDAELRGAARLEGSANARLPDGIRIDPSVSARANQRFWANWSNMARGDRRQTDLGASLNNALRASVSADRVIDGRVDAAAVLNPARASYWSNWGNTARSSFTYGANPYFAYNWWNGRSLIGLGLGGYGSGYGPGYGGWWGYQPWAVNRPWWYWYGRPLWSGLIGWFPGWGWNQPYYYDYGPGGNVVYTGSQVYVNSQPVGTTVEYAQSAAELAAVDPAMIRATNPEDWMPLGTFTLATAQDERDPARVIQLAINKEGLLSGTSYNKQTDKTYTVQGRVDKQSQRVAFTIGNAADIVMETGLFNLTQEETPVLAHLGANRTATYLLARLPEPKHEAEDAPPPAPTAAEPALP